MAGKVQTVDYIPEFTLCWNLIWPKMLRVVGAGGVEAGSVGLMAIDVKAVADKLGISMLL
jgi:hypothetical protein